MPPNCVVSWAVVKRGGDTAARIVRALGDDRRMGRALAALVGVDDKALAQIQNLLISFEDLMKLQVLMMQVDNLAVLAWL